MKKLLLCLILLTGCWSDSVRAKRVLSNVGFTDIQTLGWSWGGCGGDDGDVVRFTAKNQLGHPVSGWVCCTAPISPFPKGCTVRIAE